MSDTVCVLCGERIHGHPMFDRGWPPEDRRYGPYHVACLFHRNDVNALGEYMWSEGLYGVPYLLYLRYYGWLPERLAVWAADGLIRLAFRLMGHRGRLISSFASESWLMERVAMRPEEDEDVQDSRTG